MPRTHRISRQANLSLNRITLADILKNRWYALTMFGAAYTCHSIDRQVVSVVIEPIKHEFGVTDHAIGLLGGAVYTTSFALACLPIGWLIDRVNRRSLLCVLLSVWGGLTLLTGFAGSFMTLVAARMGVGGAEAGGQPVCLALIADFFAPAERSTAIGYFYLSTAIGIVISFLGGGWIVSQWGWHAAFFMAGIPGLIVATVIALTITEPPRGAFETTAHTAAPFGAVARHLLTFRPLLHLAIGMTLTAMTVSTMWLWCASLLIRLHGLPIAVAGPIVAVAAAFSAVGSAVTGRFADAVGRRTLWRRMLVPAFSTLLCAPAGIGFALWPSVPGCVACLMGTGFLMGGFLGPCFSAMTVLAPVNMRGAMAALLQVSINLIGGGLGPLITGSISDFFGSQHGLAPALAILMVVNVWSAGHFFYVAYLIRRKEAVLL